MRSSLYLVLAVSGLSAALFTGCGDGEEGGGGGTGGGTGGVGGTGGTGGTGGDASGCPDATFTFPANGAVLTSADDSDSDCSNGIDLNVTVATNATSGTSAALLADGAEVGTASVSGASLTFTGVQLKSSGSTELTVRFGGDSKCDQKVSVTSQCSSVTCDISKPALSPTHPKLNGVPAAQGGDRASAPGADYQAAFEVTTNAEDGQPVTLTVDGKAQAAVALANAGVATFPGVTLTPDGDHKVSAQCKAQGGETGASAEITYPVDTTAPDLANTSPVDGHFFLPADDSNATKTGLQFKVCGETTAPDAVDLPASLGAGQNNFCVAIGTATPTCAAATATGANGNSGGCVELDCPGGAPFDLTVSLKDDAGNPATKTIQGVRCTSTLPSVQIVEPVDGTGSDVSKHILAANATQTRKDQDANTSGAQYTVVACTDAAGSSGQLQTNLAGGTPTNIGAAVAAVAAVPADNCPTGFGFVFKFTNATLLESAKNATTGALTAATELRVEVTDVSTATSTSPVVAVWVDSVAPTISEALPNPLCDKLYQSTTPVQQDLRFNVTDVPISVSITTGASTQSFPNIGTAPGFVQVGIVTFPVGISQVSATVTDAAGNTGALKSPCAVTVGNPPVVNWVAPSASTPLNASTDGGAAAGWQGTLTVQTDVGGSGGTVTFEVDCGGTVTTLGNANIDAGGAATLANVTIPECASAKITAKTSNISGKGVGTATLTKPVDTVVPDAPTGLSAAVKDRRQTSFSLGWTAPADSGQAVAGYAVRVSKAPITTANFDAAEAVAFTGSPKAPGGAESLDVTDRHIENDYYFAIAATDAAGNRSTILSAGPAKATFNSTVLSGSGTELFGFAVDGSASINGDALADLLVGARTGNLARVYFGATGGYSTTPSITITGVSGSRFGFSSRVVGDIDSDGFADLAIGAPLESSRGRVYVFKGRASWPSALDTTQADYVIDVDTAADPNFNNSTFGTSIAPLGDFNGDGAADFAVGAGAYQAGRGYVAVILGVPTGSFPATVTLPAAVGTRALAFLGDAAIPSGNFFGNAVTGLASYYTGGLPALVIGANGSQAGRVYAFKGGSAVKTTNQVSDGETYAGSAALRTGGVLSNLGPIAGLPTLGVGSPSTNTATGGDARLFFGNAAAGVFAGQSATFTNSAASAAGDQFGSAVFGGGFSGSTVSVSLIDGAGADVAFSSVKLGGASPPKLYFIDGAKATASGDVVNVADVVYTLPAGWLGAGSLSGPVRDSNGDGYAEIAITEAPALVSPAYAGRVLVLW